MKEDQSHLYMMLNFKPLAELLIGPALQFFLKILTKKLKANRSFSEDIDILGEVALEKNIVLKAHT